MKSKGGLDTGHVPNIGFVCWNLWYHLDIWSGRATVVHGTDVMSRNIFKSSGRVGW